MTLRKVTCLGCDYVRDVTESHKFCEQCGRLLQDLSERMTCRHCNTQADSAVAHFCHACGSRLIVGD